MKMDIITLAFVSSAVDVFLVIMLCHRWFTQKTYPGFRLWIAGGVCWASGSVLNMILNNAQTQFIPKIIGTGLIMSSLLLKYEGFNRFYGIRMRRWNTLLNVALLLVFLSGQAYYLYIIEDFNVRTVNTSLFLTYFIARIVLLPLLNAEPRRNYLQWSLSILLMPLIFIMLFRSWMYSDHLANGSMGPMIVADELLNWLIFYSVIVELMFNYVYLWFTDGRIEAELRQSTNKYRDLSTDLQRRVDEEAKHRVTQERVLANQSRLASMGEMINVIAHQWRQPLSTLGLMIQRVHVLGIQNQITLQYLGEFKASAMSQIRFMSDTIDEFSEFFSPVKMKKEYSPVDCIRESIRLLEPQFNTSSINVSLTCDGCESTLANGFSSEFKQVILNLLSNGRDAILDRLAADGEQGTGCIRVTVQVDTGNVMTIDLSDNGCGMATNITSRIFDPYFTTKADRGGTGIGLYISRMLVENIPGGNLRLIKHTGGATFRIEMIVEEAS